MPFRMTIPARRIALILGAVAVYLAVQSIVAKYVQADLGDNSTRLFDDFVRLFNINREQSFPTWYSSMLLFLGGLTTAVLAGFTRAVGAPYRWRWLVLSLLFFYLSADEGAGIHEYLTDPIGEALDTTGVFYFGWIIAGIIAVVVVGLLYFPFWRHLDTRTRILYLIAAGLYVGGGLGIEMLGSNEWYLEGGSTLRYSAIGTVEELFEMLGAVTFIYAQLQLLARFVGAVELHIVDGRPQSYEAPADEPVPAEPA